MNYKLLNRIKHRVPVHRSGRINICPLTANTPPATHSTPLRLQHSTHLHYQIKPRLPGIVMVAWQEGKVRKDSPITVPILWEENPLITAFLLLIGISQNFKTIFC